MNIKKDLNKDRAIRMIEALLESKKNELPDTKTLNDLGGGYVECIKTKANVVLYFGFDGSKNRVSIKCQINREDVLLWTEALAERIWNVETAEEALDIDNLLATAEPSKEQPTTVTESLFPPVNKKVTKEDERSARKSIFDTI